MRGARARARLTAPPRRASCLPSRLRPLDAQAAHSDGNLALVDPHLAFSLREVAGRRRRVAVPLTAVLSLAQPASLLLSPYSPAEDVALGDDDEAARAYPAEVLPMVRRAFAPFSAFVFGQETIHAGDSCGAAHHARMHLFFEHPDVPVSSDHTSIVGKLGKKVASYYAAPA